MLAPPPTPEQLFNVRGAGVSRRPSAPPVQLTSCQAADHGLPPAAGDGTMISPFSARNAQSSLAEAESSRTV
eukprot:scaffold219005_cov32-Tisochrysis_lutea.AAC.4